MVMTPLKTLAFDSVATFLHLAMENKNARTSFLFCFAVPMNCGSSYIQQYLGDPKKDILQSGVTRSVALKTAHLVNFCIV